MGWTSTDARFYTADGKINRKAECDNLYTWEDERRANKVLKSSMRGSVYYAAVQTTDKNTGGKEVFAVVCLTSTRWDGGFNFGYKGMTEDMGPCEDDCPKGILDILTDTESKYAKEWRERCRAKLRDKKQSCQSLSSVKIGEVIEFEYGGRTIRAEKMAPAYQFKTPWFKVVGELEYIAKTRIKDWRIVAEEEANEPVKHISEIMETCRLHDEETGEETDEYRYYKWLAYCHTSGNYRTISDKALAEALAGIDVTAYRKGKGHIIAMNKDGVLIETVISSQPTETPQISTGTAETVNVSAEPQNEPREAKNKPERKIKYFHYTSEQLKRYIIDVYEKRANGEWVLDHQEDSDLGHFDVIGDKVIYWHNKSENDFSYSNMDFNSPTCGRCFRINRTYQKDYFVVSNEKLLEFTINGNYYYILRQTVSKGKRKQCYTINDSHGDFAVSDFSYTKRGIIQRFNKWWKKNATIIWQSPEVPQMAQSLTSTDKLAQIA